MPDALDSGLAQACPGEPVNITPQRFKPDPAGLRATLCQWVHPIA
ncbi:hypothetical protein QMZ05_13275 [Bradyrhizobium sp. INPA03-11B]